MVAALAAFPQALPFLKGSVRAAGTGLPQPDFSDLPSLRVLAEKAGIFFGAAVQLRFLQEEMDFARAVQKECSMIVPEGSLKWSVLQPQENRWNFQPADSLLSFAEGNALKMRGHTLLWHNAFPAWAEEGLREGRGEALLEAHISKVVGHYKGRLTSWDVVNEAINPKDDHPLGLRDTPWLRALGPDYVAKAFRLAAQADPNARLVYNEFILEGEEDKRAAILALVRRLQDANVPIHGVGVQSHLWAPKRQRVDKIRAFCREITRMGLDYYVTELDVGEKDYGDDFEKRDLLVAERAREYLDAVLTECKPKEILTWGLSTRHSWMADPRYFKSNAEGKPIRGLPLDGAMKRTRLWHVLYQALSGLAPAEAKA